MWAVACAVTYRWVCMVQSPESAVWLMRAHTSQSPACVSPDAGLFPIGLLRVVVLAKCF